MISATENFLDTDDYADNKIVLQVYLNLDVFDLKMVERNRELKNITVKGLKYNSTIKTVSEKLKLEAIKENP